MKFFDSTSYLHGKLSFNIFAICGYLILLGYFINFIQSKLLDSYVLLWQTLLFNVIYTIILLTSALIFVFEKVLDINIKNNFIVNNRIICIIRYFGALISTIYAVLTVIFLLMLLF